MPELMEIPQAERDRIAEIGTADLVIGIFAPFTPEQFEATVAGVREAAGRLQGNVQAMLVYPGDEAVPAFDDVRVLPLRTLKSDLSLDPSFALSEAYHALLAVANLMGARASAVIVSDLEKVSPEWIYHMIQPVLELNFDLVAPRYSHARFEGLLNTAIVAPFTRALYGRQIEHPLGPDFAFSGKFAVHLLAKTSKRHQRSLASLSVDAVCGGFQICQAHVGERSYPPADWMNQSSVLTQIMGPVFQEAEQHAQYWQRVRGAQPVATFGGKVVLRDNPQAIDTQRMIESFRLAYRNLQEIWGIVLPPGTRLELGKLVRIPSESFRVPDALWARILYDFTLGYRLHAISQDHLIRAMTPLYLAWVASYVLELGAADSAAVERRNEQLAQAFEAEKPYVLSRWRWPDRFNP